MVDWESSENLKSVTYIIMFLPGCQNAIIMNATQYSLKWTVVGREGHSRSTDYVCKPEFHSHIFEQDFRLNSDGYVMLQETGEGSCLKATCI